jgi:hypothetical protein
MYKSKRYRRIEDGVIFEAVQYKRPWDHDNAITEVASFILGMDTDKATAVANENVLDIVRPLTHLWHVGRGVATIEVSDPVTGLYFEVQADDWICKKLAFENSGLSIVEPAYFEKDFEEIAPEEIRTEFNDLSDLIYENFPWEGETYQAVAEQVAAILIGNGWTRKV